MEVLTSIQMDCQQLLDKPRIYADLNGGWRKENNYVVPLNSLATENDLHLLGYTLNPGLTLDFWTDDGDNDGNLDPLLFQGVIQFDNDTQHWVAVAQWTEFHHASEIDKPDVQVAVTTNTDLSDTVVEYTEINLTSSKRTSADPKKPIKL